MAGNNVPGLENSSPQFSQNVPGAQIPLRANAGKEGEGFEHLGQSIENIAVEGAGIYDEIQRQHDISTSSKSYTDANVAHAQKLQQLKLTSPDGFIHDPDTGEIQKNSDGSQQTIAQDYWHWADQDYQARQHDMTPRAAAMFRQQMQSEIGSNTKILQNEGLKLQTAAADQAVDQNMVTLARANDSQPWSDSSPYYSQKQPDGAVLLRGNTDKINDQLRMLKLQTAQQGPTKDMSGELKAGVYNPTQVAALTAQRLSTHSESWAQSVMTDIMENNGPRDRKNALSTTALQQLYNLRDIVEGKDAQSQRAIAAGLPTVHTSLTADQIDKWRAKIDAMKPEAADVDKSEYKLALNQLHDYAKSTTDLRQFMASPLFQHTLHSGGALDMTPDERVKDLAEPFATAVTSTGVSGVTGLSSDAAKQAAANRKLQEARTLWPALAHQLGVKDVQGFGDAITAEASKQVAAKLQEDSRQRREDPMKYAASVETGPQGPGGTTRYRSGTAKYIDDRLSQDPSLLALFKPLTNGKTVFESSQQTANNVYSRAFGPRADVNALQKGQFEDQKNRLLSTRDPQQIESYFQLLNKQNVSPAQKEAYLQGLVGVGGLPQPYIDTLNLKTVPERAARWSSLLAGSTPMQDWTKQQGDESEKTISELSHKNNNDVFSLVDRKEGQNSPTAIAAKNNYTQSWEADYANARKRGMSSSDAQIYANETRDKTRASVGFVGAQHDFLGLFHWGQSGPQVPVEYGRTDLGDTQKKTIQGNLLKFQSEGELSKYKFVPVPGAAAQNPNAPTDAKWVAEHAYLWERIPGGYRLRVQEMSKAGLPTGNSQRVQILGKDSKPHYYDVQDRDAMAPQGTH